MSDFMRDQFEKKYKAPTGCYWHSMTGEYGQSWDELSGDDDIEKEIRIHNDRFLVWQASRECLVIELPNRFDEKYQDYYDDVEGGCFNEGRYINDVHAALTASGVKYK